MVMLTSHYDTISLKQRMRMETSLEALKKLQDIGKVFLTGEYWDGGDETWTAVLDLGYGLLYEKWK